MTGYSGKPLVDKLGIKPGAHVSVMDAPSDYRALLEPLPPDVVLNDRPDQSTDLVHLFAVDRETLAAALVSLRHKLRIDTPIWVSWPKKSSKVPTTITEDVIREIALPLGFVDIKVCAVSEIWSGLKLVVRKELR
jgi:hypothetical protein